MFKYSAKRLLISDMAGTTIQEKGIVYNSLFNTIKLIKPNLMKGEIAKFTGHNKIEVIKHFVKEEKMDSPNTVIRNLNSEFNYFLKKEYMNNSSVTLIKPELPEYFNMLRFNGVRVALNTGYNMDIQNLLIDKLNMFNFIDDYISSEEVTKGRPYPYMVHELMERNNIDNVSEVIKVGDTISDIREGKNAGCDTVGVLSGADTLIMLKKERPSFMVNNITNIRFI
jgi:phosphonatase-like hydrolase